MSDKLLEKLRRRFSTPQSVSHSAGHEKVSRGKSDSTVLTKPKHKLNSSQNSSCAVFDTCYNLTNPRHNTYDNSSHVFKIIQSFYKRLKI